MHIFNYIIIAIVVLALFGPKTLQSFARSAGKTAADVKGAKDKLMSDLSLDEVKKVSDTFHRVPTNSSQALRMLISSDEKQESASAKQTTD